MKVYDFYKQRRLFPVKLVDKMLKFSFISRISTEIVYVFIFVKKNMMKFLNKKEIINRFI